ncbi:hypothetical protein ACFXGR_53070 [Streptomyces mirabilis]|uniref:hypothetical protein n=1 Tax=Streptomyces mirabilis TaxID=68239 RepID=UPI0036BF1125
MSVIRRAASRARGVAVAAGLDPLGPLRGGGEHLREGRHEPAGRVGVLAQLAQDRGELRRVDVVGGEVVLDLLERGGRSPAGCGSPADAGAGGEPGGDGGGADGAVAASSSIRALPGPVSSEMALPSTSTRAALQCSM